MIMLALVRMENHLIRCRMIQQKSYLFGVFQLVSTLNRILELFGQAPKD
jgi:hypothetical protein